MTKKISWNSPFIDHKMYILDHLESLNLEPKEIVVLLLIEFYNSQHIIISDERISDKLKISVDETEEIFSSLADKGYLRIDFVNGDIVFDISGIMEENNKGAVISHSLIEEFEMEFKRGLNSNEMSRILELQEIYGDKRVLLALDEASVREVRNINYIESILLAWQQKNLSDKDLDEGKR